MKKKTKKWIILGIVTLVAAGGIGGCLYKASQYKPTLTTTGITGQNIESFLSTSGTIKLGDSKDYLVTGSTYVKKVHVEVGDEIEKGDLLVSFDNSEAVNNYKKAAIAYEKARLTIDEAERRYFDVLEDIKEAEEDKAYSKEMMDKYEHYSVGTDEYIKYEKYDGLYDKYKSTIETLEKSIPSTEEMEIQKLSFEEAKMALEKAELEKNRLPADIYAEENGVVQQVSVADLRYAERGTLAVTVQASDSNLVEFNLGKYDIPKVSLGMGATITIGAKEYQGKVSEIGNIASANSALVAKIQVDEVDSGFVSGMEVDIEILTFSNPNAMALPIEAIKTDRQGDYCYIVNPIPEVEGAYKPEKVYIKTGNSSDFYIEVLEGLTPEQKVVHNPPSLIDSYLACNIVDLSEDAVLAGGGGTQMAPMVTMTTAAG